MKPLRFHGAFLLMGLVFWPPQNPRLMGGDKQLLDFVREAHKAARESMRTCSCRVEYDLKEDKPRPNSPRQDFKGQFWYSADAVRAKVNDRGQEQDYVWKASVLEGLHIRGLGSNLAGASRARSANKYTPRDGFTLGLLAVSVPSTIESLPFEQCVDRAERVVEAKREMIDGKELVIVKLAFATEGKSSIVEVHFDPSVNYLVRKVVRARMVSEVVQFKNCTGGVFFPEQVVSRLPETFIATAHFSDIRVNEALPDGIFRLSFPNGIYMTDWIREVRYKIASDGRAISREEALKKSDGTRPPPLGQAPPTPGQPTTEEPESATRWILPVALAILAAGLGAILVRHLRRRKEQQ